MVPWICRATLGVSMQILILRGVSEHESAALPDPPAAAPGPATASPQGTGPRTAPRHARGPGPGRPHHWGGEGGIPIDSYGSNIPP